MFLVPRGAKVQDRLVRAGDTGPDTGALELCSVRTWSQLGEALTLHGLSSPGCSDEVDQMLSRRFSSSVDTWL